MELTQFADAQAFLDETESALEHNEALNGVISAWHEHRKEHPKDTQLMLAYRRAEVRSMNQAARLARRESGELGRDHRMETNDGPRDFAAGDRLIFLQNDRGMGVKNGTLGTIMTVEGTELVVKLDG